MIDKRMDALVWLRKQLETDDNDLLREMVRSFAETLMGAEADVVCGAEYGQVSPGWGVRLEPWSSLSTRGSRDLVDVPPPSSPSAMPPPPEGEEQDALDLGVRECFGRIVHPTLDRGGSGCCL